MGELFPHQIKGFEPAKSWSLCYNNGSYTEGHRIVRLCWGIENSGFEYLTLEYNDNALIYAARFRNAKDGDRLCNEILYESEPKISLSRYYAELFKEAEVNCD